MGGGLFLCYIGSSIRFTQFTDLGTDQNPRTEQLSKKDPPCSGEQHFLDCIAMKIFN